MKKLVMTAIIAVATATGMFAQSYAQDVIAKVPQTKRLVISMVGTGGLFQIPTTVVSLKKEWITNVSSTSEYLKVNAENEKRAWEVLISHQSIGNVSLVSKMNKKTNEWETSTVIMINENFSTPAFVDYLMQEYQKGFTTVVFPGPFFPVGTKHEKIAKLNPMGDAFGILGTNGWETYNSLGAVSVVCKSINKKNEKITISCMGLASPYGKDLGKLVADKCTSGEVDNILFYGVSVPPCAIDEYTTVQSLENNYLRIARKNTDGVDTFTQYQKFSRVKNVVKKGKNMIVFF